MDVENRAFVGVSIISLALRADQVAHRLHISSIAGERQTPELPTTFNSSKHRVVVIVHIRCPCRVIRMRDCERQDVAATRICITTATRVAEAEWTRAGEVALIPGDEN